MTQFNFRLRFHFLEGDNIACGTEELVVFEDANGLRLRLKSGAKGVPIKDQSRAALIGGPYESKEKALEGATIAKRALLIWAVTHKIGIDLGDGEFRGGFTNDGLKLLAEQLGRPVRNDLHGIDVYEHKDDLLFVLFDAKASVGKDRNAFIQSITEHFGAPLPITERQIVSSELYCSSFFDVSFRSRLITLISSIEALLEPSDRSVAVIALVEKLTQMVKEADIDDRTKKSMAGSLQWLRQASIGQTGRALSERLLPGKEYLGQSASRFFGLCYELRSQIVHSGRPKDPSIDLLEVANALQEFVGDLLLASLESESA